MATVLEDLDQEQRAAAEAVVGPVCIIAGAGTGKTRTVTHRLAYGVGTGQVGPRHALAVTHSRKAAAELGERLQGLGVRSVEARTFHSAGFRVAQTYWARTARAEPAPSVLPGGEEWRTWRAALRAVTGLEPDNAQVRDLMDEVTWARSRLVMPGGYQVAAGKANRHSDLEPDLVESCWERFSAAKAAMGKVDFGDLLEIACTLIETDEEVAGEIRQRWAHVTVDEYQDTDPAQQRLLQAIIGNGRNLCVVGDPRQAIYSWKGADPTYLSGFARRYPDALVFNLTRNYRSTNQVVAWANRLAKEDRAKPLVATRGDGPRPKVTQLDNEHAEAAWVVGAAKRAIAGGTPACEIAVLYRFNSAQARFEAAFARAEVPIVVADDGTFFERDEVRAVLVPFGQKARAHPEGNGLELLSAQLSKAGFDRDRPPSGLGPAKGRWESQQALIELVEALPEGRTMHAQALLAELQSLANHTHGPRADGVTLATFHKAKGLEWDVVFLAGMTDGAMPSAYAESPAELAEEERLLHVGVTRARRELHLTWAAESARGWANRPSPFLALLAPAAVPATPAQRQRRSLGRRSSGALAGKGTPREHFAAGTVSSPSSECPHCAGALKGIAARRLGVCGDCVLSVPGKTGQKARALNAIVASAAAESSVPDEQLVSRSAMLRLIDLGPGTAEGVAATAGVALKGRWAQAIADLLQE